MGKLALAGGGTGGHFFPMLAFASYLKRRKLFERLIFFGDRKGIEAKNADLLEEIFDDINLYNLRKFKGKSLLQKVLFSLSTLAVSAKISKKLEGDFKTLVFGGYTSAPLALATRLKKRPLFIHEQNAVPGAANRALSKFAKRVFVAFEEATRFFPERKVKVVGMPLREEVKRYKILPREEVLKDLGWEEKPTLLILGGSQGARTLNGLAVRLSRHLGSVRVVHITGERNFRSLKEEYKKVRPKAEVRVFPFFREMGKLLRVADFAISRAGASTAFELAYFGIPTLFVPYPYAVYDHQKYNALHFVKRGGAYLLEEDDLSLRKVEDLINNLLKDERLMREMSRRMEGAYLPQSEEKMVSEIKGGVI